MSQLQPPTGLNDVAAAIPGVILDVRYATPDNFTGVQLYNHQVAWLRREPLEQLAKVANELADDGFQIVIFDAFRPQSVQKKLHAAHPDTDYVLKVSNHCRGITVDMTLAGADGVYVDMGTDYDEFSAKSHSNTDQITTQQLENRQLLSSVMQKQGFAQHPHEWWHYDYHPDRDWPLISDEINTYNP